MGRDHADAALLGDTDGAIHVEINDMEEEGDEGGELEVDGLEGEQDMEEHWQEEHEEQDRIDEEVSYILSEARICLFCSRYWPYFCHEIAAAATKKK